MTKFSFFFPTVFLKNVKYRCKLREITMNRVRLNFFCLDIILQKSQKLVRHCFVRKPRVRCILHQRVCFVTSSNQARSHELQKYTESVWIHLVYRRITSPNKVLIQIMWHVFITQRCEILHMAQEVTRTCIENEISLTV